MKNHHHAHHSTRTARSRTSLWWAAVAVPLLTVSLVAAGCSGGSDQSSGGGGSSSGDSECPVGAFEDADSPVEITLWHAVLGLTAQTLDEFAADYNASQDKVVVKVEAQGTYEELLKKYTDALRDPETLPDIILAQDTDTQFIIDSQAAVPASACIAADPDAAATYDQLLASVKAGYTVADTLWPAGYGVSTPVLYYNRSHFEQAELDPDAAPGSLEELRTSAEAIKKARPEGTPMVYRADAWWIENLETRAAQPLVDQNNGRDGLAEQSELLSGTTDELLDWMVAMTEDGLLKTIPYSATFDAYLSVATQASSMLIETSTAATTVDALIAGNLQADDLGLDEGTDLSGLSFPDLEVGVGELPGPESPGSGQIGGNAWYMIGGKAPEDIAGAWDYISWFMQTDNQVKWTTQASYLPVISSAADSPEVQAFFSDTRSGGWLAIANESLQGIDPEFPGPVIGPYKEFRNSMRNALENVLINGEDPEAALDTANTEFQTALDEYARDVGEG